MIQDYEKDMLEFFAFFMIIILLSALMMLFYLNVIVPFNREKAYIKSEMTRSHGHEYHYWKRRLKKLYISQIPIFGRFILRFLR